MAKILIIDDDEMMRTMIREMLEEDGHTISTAETSSDGVKAAEADPPDLVITDIFMPEEGGLEVIRRLTRTLPDTKVLAISGFDLREGVDILELARTYGAAETLQKPVPAETVKSTVSKLLGD